MYSLYNFNGVSLPLNNPATDWITAPLRNGVTQTSGGYYDKYGLTRSPFEFPYELTYRCAVVQDTQALMTSTLNTLRGQVGARGNLFRYEDEDNAETQWADARLVEVPQLRRLGNRTHQELTLRFLVYDNWKSGTDGPWLFDSGILFDNSRNFDEGTNTTFSLSDGVTGSTTFSNPGLVPSHDIWMSVEAGSADITYFLIYSDGWGLLFGNSGNTLISAGDTMVVDAKQYLVQINGVDAYNKLSFDGTHSITDWFRVQPGSNTVSWLATGGSTDSTLVFQFFPQFM